MSAPFRMPNVPSRRRRGISWSTVSKAALISKRVKSANFPNSAADVRSERTRNSSISVERKRRYADLEAIYHRPSMPSVVWRRPFPEVKWSAGSQLGDSLQGHSHLWWTSWEAAWRLLFKATGTPSMEQNDSSLNMSIRNGARSEAQSDWAKALVVVFVITPFHRSWTVL